LTLYFTSDECLVPELPDDCPPILAEICKSCWQVNPDDRPTFKTIKKRFNEWEKEQEALEADSSDEDGPRNRADSIIEGAPGEKKRKRKQKKDENEPSAPNAFEGKASRTPQE
jgi:hypothetical protein